jgi:tetratricopeptide (TPR) repeat protein
VHRQVVREAVAASGGVEVDTQGDAFFCAFAAAAAALEAAARIQAGLGEGPIRVRTGLHTGTPLVTAEGYVGLDVHRAARLAAAAHGGQVVLSAATAALTGPGATLVDLGEHRFKGLAEPERVYQLGPGAFAPLGSVGGRRAPPPEALVGRAAELAALDGFLERAAAGPAVVVVEGAPGIGKTSLVRAAAGLAGGRGCAVLRAQAAAPESSLAFAVLADLLAPLLDDVVPALPAPQARALRVALLLEEGPASLDPRAVGTAFLATLRAAAGRGPLLVAVDDAQWLDAPSAGALWFAARRLEDAPIALLLARRLEGAAELPPAEVRAALGPDRLVRLPVGPLDLEALHGLLAARLGQALPRPALRAVHELSRGNPYFALEVARALAGREPAGETLPVPDDLRLLLRGRLDRLSPAGREAAVTAAALAQPSFASLAAAGCGDEALREAFDADVLEADGERLRFTHPLLAAVAAGLGTPTERRARHRRLARTAGELEQRARHLALAAEGPDAAVAAELDAAAGAARRRGAPAAAAELLERARALTPAVDAPAALRRVLDAAAAHFEAGDSGRARRLLEGLLDELPAGAERAAALVRLARLRSYDDDLRGAASLYEGVIAEDAAEVLVRAQAEEALAAALFRLRERLVEAAGHAAAAAAAAAEGGDAALRAEALSTQALCEAALGRPEAPATAAAALALEEACAGRPILRGPAFPAAVVRFWHDDLDGARAALDELVRRAGALGDESSLPYLLVLLGQVCVAQGRFMEAREVCARAHVLAEGVGQQTQLAYALAVGALADAHLGRVDAARTAAERARAVAEPASAVPARIFADWALGLLALELGDPAGALAHLEPLLAHRRQEAIDEPGATRFVPDAVEALVEAGRLEDAERELARLEADAERLGRRFAIAAARRLRGLLAGAVGDRPAALAALAEAAELAPPAELPFDHARALLALGAAQRRAQRGRDARATLARAEELLGTLGVPLLAASAAAERGRAGE